MAHKPMVGGAVYEIDKGKDLVNGTAYSIDKGKTLVGGTVYEVGFDDGICVVKCYPSISTDTDYLYIQAYYKLSEVHTANLQYSTKELPSGMVIHFSVSVYSGASGSIRLNGQTVKSVSSKGTITYDYTLSNKDITIEIVGSNDREGHINIIET